MRRATVREFLLFSILKRRLGPEAERAVPVRYASLAPVAVEVALALSLVAAMRQPERPEHAFNAGVIQLRGIGPRRFTDAGARRSEWLT